MRLKARPAVGLARLRKARMIEAFLEDALGSRPRDLTILDAGCGNGGIAAFFGESNSVIATDVVNNLRPENRAVPLVLAQCEALPFKDQSFDLVISHHVIEHVSNQQLVLAEMHRVLKPQGIVYLGTPNRTSPFMRGHVGNDLVLHYSAMGALFRRNGFEVEECYTRLLKYPDRYHCETRLARHAPIALLEACRRWYPSHCFLLRRQH